MKFMKKFEYCTILHEEHIIIKGVIRSHKLLSNRFFLLFE